MNQLFPLIFVTEIFILMFLLFNIFAFAEESVNESKNNPEDIQFFRNGLQFLYCYPKKTVTVFPLQMAILI